MKLKDKQIDFDFIGNQEPLCILDKNMISEYFKSKKESKAIISKKVTSKRKKILA